MTYEENIDLKSDDRSDNDEQYEPKEEYEGLTAPAFAKKLRNRIRALKLRIKKKEED